MLVHLFVCGEQNKLSSNCIPNYDVHPFSMPTMIFSLLKLVDLMEEEDLLLAPISQKRFGIYFSDLA